jgi:hypothetical protein
LLGRVRLQAEEIERLNEELRQAVNILRKSEIALAAIKSSRPDTSDIIARKEMSLRSLTAKLGSVEAELKQEKKSVHDHRVFITMMPGRVLVKRLKNLGSSEIRFKKESLRITPDDVIYIDDPNIISQEALKGFKVRLALTGIKPSSVAPFMILRVTERPVARISDFFLYDEEVIESIIGQAGVLHKIVDDYRKDRFT